MLEPVDAFALAFWMQPELAVMTIGPRHDGELNLTARLAAFGAHRFFHPALLMVGEASNGCSVPTDLLDAQPRGRTSLDTLPGTSDRPSVRGGLGVCVSPLKSFAFFWLEKTGWNVTF